MNDMGFSKCQFCGNTLSRGYLLGKQNRIRWSITEKGMTVFHGVPLIKRRKGFWFNRKFWLYAPCIPAARCEKCKIVLFTYDNDVQESPKREKAASLFIGSMLCTAGILTGAAGMYLGRMDIQAPPFIEIMASIMSLAMLVIGVAFVRHALKPARSDSTGSPV
jgi:hypothetical protein